MRPASQKGYLRVTTPQTSDGTTLRYTDDQRLMTKETHLPLTAKKYMEAENETLPQHLRHKLEVVLDEEPEDDDTGEGVPKVKGKPGPKPKSKDGDAE